MAVRETLNKIEELAADSMHMPLTGKILIDEDKLTQLVDEFRKELPQELGHATEIINERETILRSAQQEADKIIKDAHKQAEKLVDENDVVTKAREKARVVETQAHQQSKEIIEKARFQAVQFQDQVERYAVDVLDQLIAKVSDTLNGVHALEEGLKQSLQVFHQAKIPLSQQLYARSQSAARQNIYQQNPQNYQQEYQQNPQNYQQNPQDPQS